jgi:hypothetical protein
MESQIKPKTFKVNINHEKGRFKYSLDDFELHPNDSIEWTCPGNPKDNFGIILCTKSPMPWKIKTKKRGQKLNGTIKAQEETHTHKYVVIITEGGNIWIDDPKFIVRRHRGQ